MKSMNNKLPLIATGSQLVAGVEPADNDYVKYVPYDTLDHELERLVNVGFTIQTDNEYKENPDSPSRCEG